MTGEMRVRQPGACEPAPGDAPSRGDVHGEPHAPVPLCDVRRRCDLLSSEILRYCRIHELRIAAAESLTGGLLADAFVRIPGASLVFLGSAVTYDIRAKASILGVDRGLLEREGAVHPEVASQMARGTVTLYSGCVESERILGLSTTGVAGPGPDGGKPAGLVYVGMALPRVLRAPSGPSCVAHMLRLHGSREEIRMRTVLDVLQNVRQLTVR
ncbi:MAG: CinA family protein [Bifidobacterium sp.]|jgi:nicotinamide-nucleotide amidase|nr:CinA family protein [Bifidobacterium sp.]MCI1864390.1 CinA family protein [Bifidobacterium sp.]